MRTANEFAVAATTFLTLDPPPAENDINDVLMRLSLAFPVSTEIIEDARRLLHARFAIRMEMGHTLASPGHQPWLDLRRGSIDPFYWNRYKVSLIRSGWSPLVAATLDRSTDELLDFLGDPDVAQPWQRRGLVMGDVQSGKTASYAALICKAADAGYRMVILLTGTLENVRRQTQERLDSAFIGFDSREYLGGHAKRKRHIGVGLIDGRRDGVVFTSRDQDFQKKAATNLNIALEAIKEPVLVVTKKNKSVLERLAGWLRSKNADRDGKIDVPLLLIDDEADNASINTLQDPAKATAINAAIRDLLTLFRRASYVGFTATPFANIFIDPASTKEMLGDDLFPRHFIHVLEPPTNYVGTSSYFPGEAVDSATLTPKLLRMIADDEEWLPLAHDKDFIPGPLPHSLLEALRAFLLSCAVRDFRYTKHRDGRGGPLHRSMLVNVSRFTSVQDRVADLLHIALEDLRRAVRLHGALPPQQAAAESPEIAALSRTFRREFSTSGTTWPEALSALHDAIGPVRVQAVNQRTGAASLDYASVEGWPGVRVIAVGGNSLSRGLTLEGLSTSYFRRDPRAYDTLLQMGRWFGYRDGYLDVCRLWLTDDAFGWYEHITRVTGELKRDFLRMKRLKATPEEFGLRVRKHPDAALLITARNKMRGGMDVVEIIDVSLDGRMVESSRLFGDKRRNSDNVGHINQLLKRLPPPALQDPNALVWRQVPSALVADLLDGFAVHPLNFDFQSDSIAGLLRHVDQASPLATWTVAMPTAGDGASLPAVLGLPRPSKATRRKVRPSFAGSILVSGKSARVGSRSDLRHAIDKDAFRAAGTAPEDELRRIMQHPLLMIYVLTGEGPDGQYLDGCPLPAIGLHFPGEASGSDKQVVQYRINQVAQRAMLADEPDDDADDDDDSDD